MTEVKPMVKRWLYLAVCMGLCVLIAGLLWHHFQNEPTLLARDAKRFRLSESCLRLDARAHSIPIPEGVLWYHDLTYTFLTKPGRPGLLWQRSDQAGRFPLSDRLIAQTDTSPDKRAFLLADLESGYLYRVHWPQPEVVLAQTYAIGNYPVWQTNDIVQGTESDWETHTVHIIRTNLKTKEQRRVAFHAPELTQAPVMSTGDWVIYRALWLPEYPASHLFSPWPTPPSSSSPMYAVIIRDYVQNRIYGYLGIAGYFGKLYTGYRVHPSGRYLVGIGAPSGAYDHSSLGTELYGGEIGQPMKQITNFHAYYEQVEIIGLHLGAQFPWSPDGRWLWIRADIKTSPGVGTQNYGYLLDLEENVAYPTCQPLGRNAVEVRWSPSGQYMALGLKDKIWAVDLQTKETWLLVDRQGTPIMLLGWTLP